MDARALLLRDKPLTDWLISFTHDPRFEQVQLILRAHMAAQGRDTNELRGAFDALDLISIITDNPPEAPQVPKSGLDHRSLEEIIAERHSPKS